MIAFAQETGIIQAVFSARAIAVEAREPAGAIYLFKTGKITGEEFAGMMNSVAGTNLSVELIKKCWNEMCTITEDTHKYLNELADLQRSHNFNIHVIGNTNRWHVDYINAQGLPITYSHTFSCNAGRLNPDPNLSSWSDFDVIDLRNDSDVLSSIKQACGEVVPPKSHIKCVMM